MSLDPKTVVDLYKNQEKTIPQIAGFLGTGRMEIRKILKKEGLVYAATGRADKSAVRFKAILKLRTDGWTGTNIAKAFGLTPTYIYTICNTFYLDKNDQVQKMDITDETVSLKGRSRRKARK